MGKAKDGGEKRRPTSMHAQALQVISAGDAKGLEKLLEASSPKQELCHQRDKRGRTLLMFASVAPNAPELIEVLLKSNATLGARDDCRRNVLLYCCEHGGSPEGVETIMRWNKVRGKQLRWTHCNDFKQGPFVLAAHSLNLPLMKYLLKTDSVAEEDERFLNSPSNDVLRALCSLPGTQAAKQEAVLAEFLRMPEVKVHLLADGAAEGDGAEAPAAGRDAAASAQAGRPLHTFHSFLATVLERGFVKVLDVCLTISPRHVQEACWLFSALPDHAHAEGKRTAVVQAIAEQHVRNRTWELRLAYLGPILADRYHQARDASHARRCFLHALPDDVLHIIAAYLVALRPQHEKRRILACNLRAFHRRQAAAAVHKAKAKPAPPAALPPAGASPPPASVAVNRTVVQAVQPTVVALAAPASALQLMSPQQTVVHTGGGGGIITLAPPPARHTHQVVSIQTVVATHSAVLSHPPCQTTTTHVLNPPSQPVAQVLGRQGVPETQFVVQMPRCEGAVYATQMAVPPQAAPPQGMGYSVSPQQPVQVQNVHHPFPGAPGQQYGSVYVHQVPSYQQTH